MGQNQSKLLNSWLPALGRGLDTSWYYKAKGLISTLKNKEAMCSTWLCQMVHKVQQKTQNCCCSLEGLVKLFACTKLAKVAWARIVWALSIWILSFLEYRNYKMHSEKGMAPSPRTLEAAPCYKGRASRLCTHPWAAAAWIPGGALQYLPMAFLTAVPDFYYLSSQNHRNDLCPVLSARIPTDEWIQNPNRFLMLKQSFCVSLLFCRIPLFPIFKTSTNARSLLELVSRCFSLLCFKGYWSNQDIQNNLPKDSYCINTFLLSATQTKILTAPKDLDVHIFGATIVPKMNHKQNLGKSILYTWKDMADAYWKGLFQNQVFTWCFSILD